MTRRRKLSPVQLSRLRSLCRPSAYDAPTGVPTKTDMILAEQGLVTIIEAATRVGFYRTIVTDEGRAVVTPYRSEFCGHCGGLTLIENDACEACGGDKDDYR